jgi:hypothetical protein
VYARSNLSRRGAFLFHIPPATSSIYIASIAAGDQVDDLHRSLVALSARFLLLTCSPFSDPGVMRVFAACVAGQETLDEAEAAQSGADHWQAA